MIISWPYEPAKEERNLDLVTKPTASYRAGQISLPEAVLERHGARILRPAEAGLLPGQPVVQSTVYRTFVLLIRNDVLRQPNINSINMALNTIGLQLDESTGYDRDLPAAAPQAVGLVAADPEKPAVVDAWLALQTLRVADRNGALDPKPGPDVSRHEDESRHEPQRLIDQISLDHLVFGSAATGVGLGIVEGVPGMGNGNAEAPGGDSSSYGYWPHPVSLAMDMPGRANVKSRRVVVAVLDTGIDNNEPLGVAVENKNGKERVVSDFVRTDEDIQNAVYKSGERLSNLYPDRGIEPIAGVRDAPFTIQPLVGELATHSGHGTFITGIIRQAAPDADVLAIRVLHSDGIGYQSDALTALWKLLERVEKAQDGRADPATMVDIVSISWGHYDESPEQHLPELAKVIRKLRHRGVIVVAAAGNYATERPFYPAALSRWPDHHLPASTHAPEPVISVGALNPNGSKAIYSNEGTWVTCWATGTAVISTFPQWTNASRNPSLRVHAKNGRHLLQFRETLDGDDHRGGYRVWNGTSFAAPFVAAALAAMLREKEKNKELLDLSCESTRERGRLAVHAVRDKWKDVGLPNGNNS